MNSGCFFFLQVTPQLTWMVFVIFRGGAVPACVGEPPMLLFRLSLSRASITLLLIPSCGVGVLLTFSPCTLRVSCLRFTPARLLLVCICICGTCVWLCSWCVTAVFCEVCTGTVNWICPSLRELIIWRASFTPPAAPATPPGPPLPRILKRASFWPSISLASFTWNPEERWGEWCCLSANVSVRERHTNAAENTTGTNFTLENKTN